MARLEVVDVERWDDAREELEAVCVCVSERENCDEKGHHSK